MADEHVNESEEAVAVTSLPEGENPNCFCPGELAMLLDRKSRRYLITLKAEDTFHSHLGRLHHDQLIGGSVGGWYRTDKGHTMLAVRPTLGEYVRQMPRGPTDHLPEGPGQHNQLRRHLSGRDCHRRRTGFRSTDGGLAPGGRHEGRVITYEIDESVLPKAMRNIDRVVPDSSNLQVKIGNIYEGIDERGIDRVVLDVPEPWQAVGHIADALVMGGVMLSFLPTILQVHRLVGALEQDGRFQLIESMETLLRTWHVTERSVRPSHRMVAHSGFLTTAVRCLPRPGSRPPAVADESDEIQEEQPDGNDEQG